MTPAPEEMMGKETGGALLQGAAGMIHSCDRCGSCLTVCPLFGVKEIEAAGARGKNSIVRALAEGGLKPTRAALKAVDFCLLCRACVEICPANVPTDEAMVDVRQHLSDLFGGPKLEYRIVGGILKRPGLVSAAAKSLALLRRVGLNRLVPHGMAPEEFTRCHFLGSFAGPAALGRKAPPSGKTLAKATPVSYFHGCGMEMMFPEAAAQSREIIGATAPLIEKRNVCCGLPHLAHGKRQDFLSLALKNIEIFDDAEVVVTDCASCGATLKNYGSFFADAPALQKKAEEFSKKVMDLTEYLVQTDYKPRQRTNAVLTYHDPCHLARGQGITNQPRELLRKAGNFIEMNGAGICCGGAGSFHIDYPETAAKILANKQRNIEETGASLVVTDCPGCLIQLAKAAEASDGRFKAVHISQVL
ncbi:MAG: (Fe-S)-binding protein [Syntrophales bacterium]